MSEHARTHTHSCHSNRGLHYKLGYISRPDESSKSFIACSFQTSHAAYTFLEHGMSRARREWKQVSGASCHTLPFSPEAIIKIHTPSCMSRPEAFQFTKLVLQMLFIIEMAALHFHEGEFQLICNFFCLPSITLFSQTFWKNQVCACYLLSFTCVCNQAIQSFRYCIYNCWCVFNANCLV